MTYKTKIIIERDVKEMERYFNTSNLFMIIFLFAGISYSILSVFTIIFAVIGIVFLILSIYFQIEKRYWSLILRQMDKGVKNGRKNTRRTNKRIN